MVMHTVDVGITGKAGTRVEEMITGKAGTRAEEMIIGITGTDTRADTIAEATGNTHNMNRDWTLNRDRSRPVPVASEPLRRGQTPEVQPNNQTARAGFLRYLVLGAPST